MRAPELEPTVRPSDLSRALSAHPGVRLLDVRTHGEYTAAHIRGAYNVPLDALGEHAAEICAIDTPVVLICQSGQRARQAETTLAGSGMPHLHLLEGGMRGWLANGLPVVRGPARLSLERQVRIAAGTLSAAGGLLALIVTPWFAVVPAVVGSGLVFSGLTDTCGMAMLLARLPYNRGVSCDTAAMVRALRDGVPPNAAGDGSRTNDQVGCHTSRLR
jgi:rhodanese-related sulfurtransferase